MRRGIETGPLTYGLQRASLGKGLCPSSLPAWVLGLWLRNVSYLASSTLVPSYPVPGAVSKSCSHHRGFSPGGSHNLPAALCLA